LVALVSGEAGVGKTRLADQVAATAAEQGMLVLRGGCVPLGEEGVPFAPVTEALRGLARALDPDELEAVAGPAHAELGRLVPDLAWGDGAAAGPAVAGAGQGRLFELLLGVVERLGARSTGRCSSPSRAVTATSSAMPWSPRRSMASCFPASGSASIPRWPVRWRPASAPGTLRRPGRRASPTTGRQPATSPAP
jgi:hypothetical protein